MTLLSRLQARGHSTVKRSDSRTVDRAGIPGPEPRPATPAWVARMYAGLLTPKDLTEAGR